jgi:hypothetical protein
MDEGLTGGGKKEVQGEGMMAEAKKYVLDFGALPTQVYWLLLLELLNGYRRAGLSSAQYQYLANEWSLCDDSDGIAIPDCDTDIETGKLLGLSSTINIVAGIVGSMATDAIGVRKIAMVALSLSLMGRTIWTFASSKFLLYIALFFFTPFGEALLSAGLYKVALKKLTPPKQRPFAFAMQYQTSNLAYSCSYLLIDPFKAMDDTEMFGMTFSGLRMFILTTWFALAFALVIAVLFLKDHTVIDVTDPEPEAEGITMPTVDINGVPLSEEPPMPPIPEGATGLLAWRARVTRKYRIVETPLLSAGFVPKMQAMAKEQGYGAAIKSAVNSLGTQFSEVSKLRNLWMVIAFSWATFFVSKQWGDMDSLMPVQMVRMYGVDTPAYSVSAINTVGCTLFAATVAAFTGPKETFAVMLPGLWIMAVAPVFLWLDTTLTSAVIWISVLTLGELFWSPRNTAWAATVAPVGREGVFVAVSSIKDLLSAFPSQLFNGWMNSEFNPNCHDCRGLENFCGDRFVNDTLIGCKTPGDDGEFCPMMKWVQLENSEDKDLSPDWCDDVTTCYQCQPENLMPGADLYETGWQEHAGDAWLVMLLVSMTSPLLVWIMLPFLRGEGTSETYYDIFTCGPGRLAGICGLGGSQLLTDTLMSSDEGGGEAGGDWTQEAPPTEPAQGPLGDAPKGEEPVMAL